MRACLLLIVVAVGACGDRPVQPPTEYQLELVQYRAIERTPAGLRYVFDRERVPTVLTIGPAPVLTAEASPSGPEFRLVSEHDAPTHLHGLVELPDARRIEVRQDGRVVARWVVRWDVPPAKRPALVPVVAAREAGRLEDALRALDAQTLTGADHLWGTAERARLLHRLGRADDAAQAWRRAAEEASRQNVPTEAAARLRAASYLRLRSRAYAAQRSLLAESRTHSAAVGDREGLALADYHQALGDLELGRYRAALRGMEDALERLTQVGASWVVRGGRTSHALLLQALGRHAEALRVLETVRPTPADGAKLRFAYLNNLAWVLLDGMFAEKLPPEFGRVREALEAAAPLARAAGGPAAEANVQVNLAWAWFLDGDRARAAAALARGQTAEPWSQVFAELLAAELSLAAGEAQAAQRFAAVAGRAREQAGGDADPEWRARWGEGRARLAAGDPLGALAAWRAGLAVVERLSRRTGLRASRATFLGDRRKLVDDLLRLLVERGELAEAFTVADRNRARVLRALTTQARVDSLPAERLAQWSTAMAAWQAARATYEAGRGAGRTLPADARPAWDAQRARERAAIAALFERAYALLDVEAAPVADTATIQAALGIDEVVASYVRVGDRWTAFLVTNDSVAQVEPAADWLTGLTVGHLYVVDGGAPAVHALLRRAAGRVSVSYLPYAGWLAQAERPVTGAPLVLADPTGDLPHARREGTHVAERLGTTPRLGRAADRAALLTAETPWLHFAGHGVLRPDDPWAAHLRLAGGDAVQLTDVLAARPALGVVVLSGCETGRSSALARAETIGLPEAFLAAGAQSVLAADTVLPDADARRFVETFYAQRGAPAERLRAAIAAMRAKGDSAWVPWRLFGRR